MFHKKLLWGGYYDCEETCKNILAMYQALNEDAKRKGCKAYIKTEILEAQNSFLENPCLQTATKLLDVDPASDKMFILKGDTAVTPEQWLFILERTASSAK